MRKKRMLLSWLVAGMALCMQAQQTAVKMVADGHYQGARQQFERFLDNADEGEKGYEEAQALSLVCDYVLGAPATADRLGEWTEENPLSQYAEVLRVFRRNLLVKEQRFDEALESFFEDEAKGISIETPLPYPLTGLSDEAYAYQNVIYRLAGDKLYDEGNYEKALGYLEAGEKTRTSQYKLGMCYYNMGRFDAAYNTLVESASIDQDEMAQNAWLHAGIAALQLNKKSEAQKAFLNASQMNQNPALREQALYDYALTLHEQSAATTVSVMEQFLKEFPTSKYATSVSQCLTEVYMQKKDYSKALSAINKVQTPNSDTQADKQKVLYNLAFQELNMKHLQDALTYATQAVALGKQDIEAYAESYYIKGDCDYQLGNYAQAANDLTTALNLGQQTPNRKLKNNDYALYTLGYAQFKQQKYNAAIEQFQKITAMSDNTSTVKSMKADAYNRIGDCYLNMRNYGESNANYELAKKTYYGLGDYSMLQQAYIEGLNDNYDKKIQMIEQMLAEYPGSSLTAKALYEQGRAYVLSGKEDEASAIFSSISRRFPQSEYAQKAREEIVNMATNIAIQDSIAAAQDSIANEAAKAPVVAAQNLYNAGQYQQAEQVLNKAIDEGIGKPYWLAKAFILMSDIYRAEGRLVEAKQTLESLKANYKENDDVQTLIEERLRLE
ncbi:MAG: tetratricopeptide repeat protein [Bacteroidaceae bacterium]|nr:tetratricopeptide repeat protein [Bacteroidaceae bacterium]